MIDYNKLIFDLSSHGFDTIIILPKLKSSHNIISHQNHNEKNINIFIQWIIGREDLPDFFDIALAIDKEMIIQEFVIDEVTFNNRLIECFSIIRVHLKNKKAPDHV